MSATDIFQLNKNGTVELVEKNNDNLDILYASKSNGKIDKSKSLTVLKGILDNQGTGTIQNPEGGDESFTYFQIQNDKAQPNKLFEFMADNSNVEFGLTKMKDGRSFITTSNDETQEVGGTGIKTIAGLNVTLENVKEHTHSHPAGIEYPSGRPEAGSNEKAGADVLVAQIHERRNPSVKFYIYTPLNKKYTGYSGATTREPLPEIIVTPKRSPKKK